MPIAVLCSKNDLITVEEVKRAVKLRLLANNMVPRDYKPLVDPWFLKVNIRIIKEGSAFYLNVQLCKDTKTFAEDKLIAFGSVVIPEQGYQGKLGVGTDKKDLINALNECIDSFLLDYLETNIEMIEALKTAREIQKKRALDSIE